MNRSRSRNVPSPIAGHARLGDRAERRESRPRFDALGRPAASPIGGVKLPARAECWRVAPLGKRRGQHPSRATAPHSHHRGVGRGGLPHHLVPGQTRPARQLERDRPRGRADLEYPPGRDSLERGRQQHLEPASQLEVLGVEAMTRGRTAVVHDSNPCSRIALRSDSYPASPPGCQVRTPSRSIAGRRLSSS